MSSIEVIGGEQLNGELKIQGSKNAALPVIAATILNKGISRLNNCPKIHDVMHMVKILEELGCETSWEGNTLIVNSRNANITKVPEDSVRRMRSSILYLGAILGRFHEVTIAYPGGCSIGKRPIDYHLNAIKKMNVIQEFEGEEDSIIHCYTNKIVGNDIFLEFPSVGATQNVILTAVLAEGITRIYNAAREPEIIEVCNYLVEAGARICGRGSAFIEIEGVKRLHDDVEFNLSSDRIVAGTYMAAVAASRGKVTLVDAPVRHLDSTIRILRKTGCKIDVEDHVLKVSNKQRPLPVNITTQPYPGFPTDMQSQLLSLLCLADGESTIIEEIFESRFQNVLELGKMGAKIQVDDIINKATINGVNQLHGAVVQAHDLRGGAGLVIAGLVAEGTTIIKEASCIERGYEDICRDLKILGSKIRYCSDNS